MNFNRFVRKQVLKNPDRYRDLHADLISAQSGLTIENFLRYAIGLAVLAGIWSGVFGYLFSNLIFTPEFSIDIYNVFNLRMPYLNIPVHHAPVAMPIFGGLASFLLGNFVTYRLLLCYPAMKKSARVTKINLSLHSAVSYMYSMRRGGAELIYIFTSLSENADIYGEVALEFRQVVRDTEFFGYDVLTALRNLRETTPSEKMKDFLEDMLSVIESGGDVSAFLASRIRIYQEEARFEQKEFLNTLGLVGESYVTAFVAGPLFLIIIMVVMGMMGRSAVIQLSALAYGLLPIGSLIFIIFIDMISIREVEAKRYRKQNVLNEYPDVTVVKRGGEKSLFEKLRTYERRKIYYDFFRHPMEWFISNINRVFLVTVPLAIVYLILVFVSVPQYSDPELYYAIIDDHIVIAAILILIPYAVLYEIWRRRVHGIERSIPDFLNRMAGINRVGLTLANAIGVMVRANLGLISYEVKRIKRDIDWGANVNEALIRFEERVQTAAIARTVTLITKASQMSGDVGEVLAIASSDAKMSESLKKERLSEMFIYTAIIYLAFFVFIFVVFVLDTQFLTILESTGSPGTATSTGMITTDLPIPAFRRLLYHCCLVQALFSGLIAGQMGESSIKAGVKHAVILLIIAVAAFNLLI